MKLDLSLFEEVEIEELENIEAGTSVSPESGPSAAYCEYLLGLCAAGVRGSTNPCVTWNNLCN